MTIVRKKRSSSKRKQSDWHHAFWKQEVQRALVFKILKEINFELRMFIYELSFKCESIIKISSVIQDHKRVATQKPLLTTVST